MTPTIGSAKHLTPVVTRSLTWPITIPGFVCTHPHRRISRDISAGMTTEKGHTFLRLADDRHPLRHFDKVVMCVECDEVLEYEFKVSYA